MRLRVLTRLCLLLWLLITLLTGQAQAQARPDSLRLDTLQTDTAFGAGASRPDSLRADSLLRRPVAKDTIRLLLRQPFDSDSFRFGPRLFYRFTKPIRYTVTEKQWEGRELAFYIVISLLLFFAFIKNSFPRYLTDLFGSYFRTTMRQKQVKEQLLQSPLPSLLFNLFFVLSAGVFAALMLMHFRPVGAIPFWLLTVYCAGGLLALYTGKFLVLKVLGWIFQQPVVTDMYSFVVFSTNKILGIALLPVTVLLAFTQGTMQGAAVTLGIITVVALFLYRFFLSFLSINQTVRIHPVHFLLYIAAFEIFPLLLINKLLFTILSEMA